MRRALLAAAAFLALAAAAFAACVALAPFQTQTALIRARLAVGGVLRVRLGALLAYERDGCAPGAPCRCVALIHGLGDSALTWRNVLVDPRASRPGLLVVALDRPGTDGSPPPADAAGWGVRAQARAVRESLEARCPRWTVAANSLGGWIALWLALDWPSGVERLVLDSPAGVDDPTGDAERAARMLGSPSVEGLKAFVRRTAYLDRKVPERVYPALLAAILARGSRETVAALRREELLDRRLGALRAPTTIVWGDADGVIPISAGRRMAGLIKGARFLPVQRCGHLEHNECPEPFARALLGPR